MRDALTDQSSMTIQMPSLYSVESSQNKMENLSWNTWEVQWDKRETFGKNMLLSQEESTMSSQKSTGLTPLLSKGTLTLHYQYMDPPRLSLSETINYSIRNKTC